MNGAKLGKCQVPIPEGLPIFWQSAALSVSSPCAVGQGRKLSSALREYGSCPLDFHTVLFLSDLLGFISGEILITRCFDLKRGLYGK